MARVDRDGLQVEEQLASFIEEEALPGSGVEAGAFWQGLSTLIHDFAPENAALLALSEMAAAPQGPRADVVQVRPRLVKELLGSLPESAEATPTPLAGPPDPPVPEQTAGDPDAIDKEAVAAELPYGKVTVVPVPGGLEIPNEDGSDSIVIANAAVIVCFDE